MKYVKRLFIYSLFIVLSFCAITMIEPATTIKVEAATKAPVVITNKTTLYVGFKTHQIKFYNLNKNSTITYKSSNTKYAKVSNKGVVTPVAAGKATITATIMQNNKTYKLKVAITVEKPSIVITASMDYVNLGDSRTNRYEFTAKTYGMNTTRVIWSVSDESVATINQAGILEIVAPGVVTIYAKAEYVTAKYSLTIGSNRFGTFDTDITVYDNKTVWISIAEELPNEKLQVEARETGTLTYTLGAPVNGKYPLQIHKEKIGSDVLTITSNKTTDQLKLNVVCADKPDKPNALTASEIYDKYKAYSVKVEAIGLSGYRYGSGFYISNSTIITDYDLVRGSSEINVLTDDGRVLSTYEIQGYDKELGLAVLTTSNFTRNSSYTFYADGTLVEAIDSTGIPFSDEEVAIGDIVYALGSNSGDSSTAIIYPGVISDLQTSDQTNFIQTNLSITETSSGGPLLNTYGEVVGINLWRTVNGQSKSHTVSIKDLYKINTNGTQNIGEYYTYYKWEQFSRIVKDDQPNGHGISTSVPIQSGSTVTGTLTSSVNADWYEFKPSDISTSYFIVDFENQEDMKHVHLMVIDYFGYYYLAEIDPGNLRKYVSVKLPDLYSYVCVFTEEGYSGSAITYSLTAKYK